MVELRDKEIGNEQIELKGDGVCYLGPNLTLKQCRLTLRLNSRDLIIAGAKLIGCSIEVKKALVNLPWYGAYLKDCKLSGTFTGCDFGQPELGSQGWIEGCDLAEARLEGCRFMACDVTTLRLPSWPCFTVLEPFKRSEELKTYSWPGEMKFVVNSFSRYPPSTSAVTFSAKALAKQFKTTEEDIQAALKKVERVIF